MMVFGDIKTAPILDYIIEIFHRIGLMDISIS